MPRARKTELKFQLRSPAPNCMAPRSPLRAGKKDFEGGREGPADCVIRKPGSKEAVGRKGSRKACCVSKIVVGRQRRVDVANVHACDKGLNSIDQRRRERNRRSQKRTCGVRDKSKERIEEGALALIGVGDGSEDANGGRSAQTRGARLFFVNGLHGKLQK